MKERMEHNLRYNDDSIFDNISIFRDVEKPGHIPKKLKQNDIHPLRIAKN